MALGELKAVHAVSETALNGLEVFIELVALVGFVFIIRVPFDFLFSGVVENGLVAVLQLDSAELSLVMLAHLLVPQHILEFQSLTRLVLSYGQRDGRILFVSLFLYISLLLGIIDLNTAFVLLASILVELIGI